MKKNSPLVKDVESLVEESIADAATEVWDKFENAMNQLDKASQTLLKQFFDGREVDELCRLNRLSRPEVETLLTRARRQLVENLRQGFQARQ